MALIDVLSIAQGHTRMQERESEGEREGERDRQTDRQRHRERAVQLAFNYSSAAQGHIRTKPRE